MAATYGIHVTLAFKSHAGGTTFRTSMTLRKLVYPLGYLDQSLDPLIDQSGNCLPFAPLLRTRETLPYGIIRSSWTLYQPHALVWNYAFWNGQINFGKACRLGANKIPHLKWEQIVPPPFLKAWFGFLQLCENRNIQGKGSCVPQRSSQLLDTNQHGRCRSPPRTLGAKLLWKLFPP